eukprot:9634706-Alexandrium_andersonii.AAC.1
MPWLGAWSARRQSRRLLAPVAPADTLRAWLPGLPRMGRTAVIAAHAVGPDRSIATGHCCVPRRAVFDTHCLPAPR